MKPSKDMGEYLFKSHHNLKTAGIQSTAWYNSANGPAWYYFAYGMNMDLEGMSGRCPTASYVGRGRLDGWMRHEAGVYDIAQGTRKDCVNGSVFIIDAASLRPLDGLEGFPGYYDRMFVPVTLDDDTRVVAMTYYMAHRPARIAHGERRISMGYGNLCARAAIAQGIKLDNSLRQYEATCHNDSWEAYR